MQIHCNEGDDYNDEINEHDAVLDDNDDAGQVEDRRRRERENAAGLREAWTGNGRPPMDSQVIVMVVLMMIVATIMIVMMMVAVVVVSCSINADFH